MMERLRRHRARLSRLGLDLRCALLPVVYAEIGPRLETLVAVHQPDAILHLGLASRRRHVSVETRAINRAGPLHPDAARRFPRQVLAPAGPAQIRATYRAAAICAALRRAGCDARLSIDAGDYVCNATLYESLRLNGAARIGFVHVPRVRRAAQPIARTRRSRPTLEVLTQGMLAAVIELARDPVP